MGLSGISNRARVIRNRAFARLLASSLNFIRHFEQIIDPVAVTRFSGRFLAFAPSVAKVSFGRARPSGHVLWHRLTRSAMVRMVSTRTDFTDGVDGVATIGRRYSGAQQAAPLRPRDCAGFGRLRDRPNFTLRHTQPTLHNVSGRPARANPHDLHLRRILGSLCDPGHRQRARQRREMIDQHSSFFLRVGR